MTMLPASDSATMRELPDLPEVMWHPLTLQWWEAVWNAPIAQEIIDVDVPALLRLAMLVNQYWYEPDLKLAAEIRIEEQSFGLTPLSRKRLAYQIEQTDEAVDRGQSRRIRQATPRPAGDDPRRGLHSA